MKITVFNSGHSVPEDDRNSWLIKSNQLYLFQLLSLKKGSISKSELHTVPIGMMPLK
ncbi:hypothetical protein Palpr_1082 [Paludibacter propionicigenes WB4]|uniref:Uncharacterized protein n=1 Tax=Paludibacter propionicigenes (strain DSM 17365 / JCM 13257 / WB4) TaxID=694427 RepID=E4T3D7_PALPW|nr:hypothetical protein Palpr_1082 [Paludibacter propionicigenes WB4]